MTNVSWNTDAVWSLLSSGLRRFVRRRVPDDATADDLVQEVFVRIHRGLASVKESDRLAAWVYRVAKNVLTDYYRAAPPRTVGLDAGVEIASEASRGGEMVAAPACMGEIIEQLPPRYRDAVRLAEIEGLSQQEVADRLGISLSGAKSRVQRGRRLLRQALTACCRFEVDRRGNVVDVDPRPDRKVCLDCDPI